MPVTSNEISGFTLIELMIAISLLSLLLFTGSYSYSLMSERWNKELGQFSESAKNAKHLAALQQLLEGVQSFVVVDDRKQPSFFFIGDNTSLLAVSRSGIFSGEYPEIFRLTTIEKEDGKVDLLYQSSSTENTLLVGTDQSIDFSRQLILFTDLDSVQFNYYGWSHLYKKNAENQNVNELKWFNRFSGIDNQIMPQSYEIVIMKSGKVLNIPVQLEQKSERWIPAYLEWIG
jgi:prepilin-type N-terminal cleavage/methylation domain-containing protein